MSDKVCEILRKTNDGDDLSAGHLALIEAKVNGGLNERGEQAFEELYQQVVSEEGYRRPWLHGIEHLTKAPDGYVYWRGVAVEHYSFRDYDEERRAARVLGGICRRIEADGKEVTGKTVLEYFDISHDEREKARARKADNARFWVLWNGDWVKLRLKPDMEVQVYRSESHDEGYSFLSRRYSYEAHPENRIELVEDSGGRDCDGPISCRRVLYASMDQLAADNCYDENRSLLDFGQPRWAKESELVEDPVAQAAGY